MNKKGFTLIELLATITIIGIIMGIGVISYTSIIERSKDQVYHSYEDSMHVEAQMYLLDHPDKISLISTSTDNPFKLMLSDLNMEPIKNPNNSDDKCLNSYVEIIRNANDSALSLNYRVCLICEIYNHDGEKCKDFNFKEKN